MAQFVLKLNDDGSVTWEPVPIIGPGPDPDPDPEPEPEPEPEPPPVTPGKGIWISREEIMALPTTGAAWEQVETNALRSWGTANLGDNNATHDVYTLAGALYAVRQQDDSMRGKVIEGLRSAMKSGLDRTLELSRGLQTYIIAADIIGYTDSAFRDWVVKMIMAPLQGHSGTGIMGTAEKSATNWGGHARASWAAAALYLNHQEWIDRVVAAHKGFIGAGPNQFNFQNTDWHADPNNKVGVNRKGAIIQGRVVSGVLPEDWRRAASFRWPPSESGYMWEGMQGFVVTAAILHRAGLVPFTAGDSAVVRAMNMLYGMGEAAQNSPKFYNPPEGDDRWIPWVVNRYAGTNFPTETPTTPGKGMGYTDWTFS